MRTLLAREQAAIAAAILEELEDEARWGATFVKPQDVLARLACEAMTKHRAGKTQELAPETL